jgi:hypothetical protein
MDPFQLSASGRPLEVPTATHSKAETHEIPSNELFFTAGVVSKVQSVPFQTWTIVARGESGPMDQPTAVQYVLLMQETEVRSFSPSAGGATFWVC